MAKIIELQQLDKITAMLAEIKTVNNYLNTIKEINQGEVSPEDIAQRPAVNVIMGNLEYGKYEQGRLTKSRRCILDTWYDANTEKEAQEIGLKLVADFEIRFCDDTQGGNTNYRQSATAYNLENTCLTVIPVGVTLFDVMEGKNIYNLEWEFTINFRQKTDDPTQQY